MVILERKTILGIPVEYGEELPANDGLAIEQSDPHNEFPPSRRFNAYAHVQSPDVLSVRGESRFSNTLYYSKETINHARIKRRDSSRNPFVSKRIIWKEAS